MKLKKAVSVFLSAAMLAAPASIIAYADKDYGEEMTQALTYVKQRVEIPEEYSVFDYYQGTNYGRSYYNFSWSSPDGSERPGSLSVSICGKVITRYQRYADEWEQDYSFGKLSKEQLAEKAEEALKKLNPTVYSYLEIDKDSLNVSLAGTSARASVRRVYKGVPVSGQNGSISVNKDTGELESYWLNWIPGAGFADAEKAVSVKTAREGYQKEFPVSKLYTAEYDWETNTFTPHLIYKRDVFGQIDALTGKLATFEGSYSNYDEVSDDADIEESAANPETGGPNNTVTFTKEEKEKLDANKNLVSPEKALQSLKDAGVFSLPDTAELTSSNTYYNERLGAYSCRIRFEANNSGYQSLDGEPTPLPAEEYTEDPLFYFDGECVINAETGEVLNYYGYSADDTEGTLKSEKAVEKAAKNALEKIAGKKAEEFRLDNLSCFYTDTDSNGNKTKYSRIFGADVSSPRYVNDIPCQSENVYLSLNADGKVSSYSISYFGIEYPAPDKILSEEEAYASYFKQVDYSLLYRCAMHEKKVETALVYNADEELYVDAFTGKLTDYSGRELITEETVSGYTDLEDSKYRKIAEKLALYGIWLMDEEGRLNEEQAITRVEFSSLISRIGFYGGRTANDEKPLTRQYMAKLLTEGVLSEELAELPGLFKSPFSDVKEDSKYVGYIAAANALGLMSGSDGKFRPDAKVSRGAALRFVYDFLSK